MVKNLLINIFRDREGPDCPATHEAARILKDPALGRDKKLQRLILDQLKELRETHRAFDGTDFDHRSPAAERARKK